MKEKENANMPVVINYRKLQRKVAKKTHRAKPKVIKKKANL